MDQDNEFSEFSIGLQHAGGCRGLIASIMNQAIFDGSKCRNPRPPWLRCEKRYKKLNHDQNIFFISLFNEMNNFVDENCILRKKEKKKKVIFPYFILHIYQIIGTAKTSDVEKYAWEARQFMNEDSEIFNIYCDLLDLDPSYLSEKAKIHFGKVDRKEIKKVKYVIDF